MTPRPVAVAIIGMSCHYAKAPDLPTFWENILAGVDGIGDPPEASLTHDVYDPGSNENDRLYTKRGGYLTEAPMFDPLEFGIMPKSMDGAEPEQFAALQLSRDALADAGYLDRPFDRSKTGVILGRGTYVNRGVISCFQHTIVVDQVLALLRRLHPEHSEAYLSKLRRHLKDGLPPFNAENSPGLAHSVLVGRIANRLDLMGPAFTVDAACASSLIAVDHGIHELLRGTCDMVIAGGIQISTTHPIALLFTQLGALARSGLVRPFHARADGTLLGEGAGFLVLKRLADAERDEDRVYAVIRGIGTSSDGRAMGILAPRLEGEELAMRRAYDASGIDPETVGLLEAHGTGTPVGDEVEIEALRRLFPAGDGSPRLPIGSVKSMIGHPIPASAAAGLIKTSLALYHAVLPPTLHADEPHPKLEGSGLFLNHETRPWIHGGPHPRRAGVSAFGFGGINAHAVLEEYVPRETARASVVTWSGHSSADAKRRSRPLVHTRRDTELFVIRAEDRRALIERCAGIIAFLKNNPDVRPHDLAYSLQERVHGRDGARLAIVAASTQDLLKKAEWALGKLRDPAVGTIREISGVYWFDEPLARTGGMAFLFPGEGSQYPGMLADVLVNFPEARAWFDLMDRAFRDHSRGFLPSRSLFRGAEPTGEDATRLWDMDIAIESVFTANQAMHAILSRLGLRPDAIVGHSTGEYSALLAAGAVKIDDEGRLIQHILDGNRATERAMRTGKVPEGVLLAVGPADPEVLRGLTARRDEALYLAMDNCPHQAVVCGREDAIARVEVELRQQGAVCQRLPFTRAYHTPLFEKVAEELETYYASGQFRAPEIRMWSCATAAPFPDDAVELRRLALAQWSRPVLFRQTIEAMHESGIRIFVECGPRSNLTAFVKDTLRGKPHLAVPANSRQRSGMEQLHHLLGLLDANGLDPRLEALYEDRGAVRLSAEALSSGRKLPGRAGRAVPLRLELPELRIDDEFLTSVASDRRTEQPVAPAPVRAPLVAEPIAPAAVADPPAASVPGASLAIASRSEAMRSYLKTMEQFLATEELLVKSLLARGETPGPLDGTESLRVTSLAFVDHGSLREDDGTLVYRRTLSETEDRFLLDHTIGGTISEDPTLRALPVLPLAMSLEIMAEAASRAFPDRRPIGFHDVRVSRWISLAAASTCLEIHVGVPAVTDVRVKILVAENGAGGALAVEGTVILGDRFSDPPAAGGFEPRLPEPSRWGPDELYAEGEAHGMFHGPSFRALTSIDRVGIDGAVGTIRALPAAGLFRSHADPALLADPMTLDAASQVLGYWTAQRLDRAFIVFPFAIKRVELFGPALQPPAKAEVRVQCTVVDEERVQANLEVSVDGRPHMRITGWDLKRIDMPERLYAFRQAPRDVLLSVPVQGPQAIRDRVLCVRLELPLGFFGGDGGVWWECLAHLALGRAEREIWKGLRGERRRAEWLMGRTAAKDAVRRYVLTRRGAALFPADIEITADAHGRPIPGGDALRRLGMTLRLSLSHSDGVAIAAVGEPMRGVGVDIERIGRRRRHFEESAFTPGERNLIEGGSAHEERALRLWCAKEAVGKALGRGMMGNPLNLEARSTESNFETVSLEVSGSLAREFPDLVGFPLTAFTGREGDLIVATALYEEG